MRMFVLFIVAPLIVMALEAGCGKLPEKYGNFAKAESVELMEDAANILKVTYLPAKTRLYLIQEASDSFGSALVEKMRSDGYAVAEYVKPGKRDKYHTVATSLEGISFGYVIDGLVDASSVRVTLFVSTESLSRLYSVDGRPEEPRYTPLGEWIRKQ